MNLPALIRRSLSTLLRQDSSLSRVKATRSGEVEVLPADFEIPRTPSVVRVDYSKPPLTFDDYRQKKKCFNIKPELVNLEVREELESDFNCRLRGKRISANVYEYELSKFHLVNLHPLEVLLKKAEKRGGCLRSCPPPYICGMSCVPYIVFSEYFEMVRHQGPADLWLMAQFMAHPELLPGIPDDLQTKLPEPYGRPWSRPAEIFFLGQPLLRMLCWGRRESPENDSVIGGYLCQKENGWKDGLAFMVKSNLCGVWNTRPFALCYDPNLKPQDRDQSMLDEPLLQLQQGDQGAGRIFGGEKTPSQCRP